MESSVREIQLPASPLRGRMVREEDFNQSISGSKTHGFKPHDVWNEKDDCKRIIVKILKSRKEKRFRWKD
jgi:hypothetical protein